MVNERGSSCALQRSQLLKSDEFVQHQPRAQQIADGLAVVELHAQQPRDRREHDIRRSAASEVWK